MISFHYTTTSGKQLYNFSAVIGVLGILHLEWAMLMQSLCPKNNSCWSLLHHLGFVFLPSAGASTLLVDVLQLPSGNVSCIIITYSYTVRQALLFCEKLKQYQSRIWSSSIILEYTALSAVVHWSKKLQEAVICTYLKQLQEELFWSKTHLYCRVNDWFYKTRISRV